MTPQSPNPCQVGSLRVCLNGASGRMGERIDRACQESGGRLTVVARNSLEAPLSDVTGLAFDVVIDFSNDSGARRAIELALGARCALLTATTGLSDATHLLLKNASASIPLLIAPNTSLGIAVMRHLVFEAARFLDSSFDVSIREVHHTKKRDQPSGTAISLAESVSHGRGSPFKIEQIHSIREGDVVGDHAIAFTSAGETLTIAHHARDRDLFALGAIQLAFWISKQRPGRYGLDDWFAELKETKR